jgi:hypothetical protein
MKKQQRLRRVQKSLKEQENESNQAIGLAVLRLMEQMPDYPLDREPTLSEKKTLKFGVRFAEALLFYLDETVNAEYAASWRIREYSWQFYQPDHLPAPQMTTYRFSDAATHRMDRASASAAALGDTARGRSLDGR